MDVGKEVLKKDLLKNVDVRKKEAKSGVQPCVLVVHSDNCPVITSGSVNNNKANVRDEIPLIVKCFASNFIYQVTKIGMILMSSIFLSVLGFLVFKHSFTILMGFNEYNSTEAAVVNPFRAEFLKERPTQQYPPSHIAPQLATVNRERRSASDIPTDPKSGTTNITDWADNISEAIDNQEKKTAHSERNIEELMKIINLNHCLINDLISGLESTKDEFVILKHKIQAYVPVSNEISLAQARLDLLLDVKRDTTFSVIQIFMEERLISYLKAIDDVQDAIHFILITNDYRLLEYINNIGIHPVNVENYAEHLEGVVEKLIDINTFFAQEYGNENMISNVRFEGNKSLTIIKTIIEDGDLSVNDVEDDFDKNQDYFMIQAPKDWSRKQCLGESDAIERDVVQTPLLDSWAMAYIDILLAKASKENIPEEKAPDIPASLMPTSPEGTTLFSTTAN